MLKADLRKAYLQKQRDLSPVEHQRMSEQIADNLFVSVAIKDAGSIHLFFPIEKNNEIDTRHIYQRLWHKYPQIETFVPRVDFEHKEIESVTFHKNSTLLTNKWDISEPENDEIIDPKNIDLVLVPLLSFDRRGYRVGYGKGFYDRFLAKCRQDCLKVGLSHFEPVNEISDINEHDIKLDLCITPEKLYRFTK